MALYSPMPSYPTMPKLAVDSPSSSASSSSNTTPSPTALPNRSLPLQRPQQSPRHLTRSEKMLMAALRRADEYERSSDADTDFSPAEITWVAGVSPSRSLKRPHHHQQQPSPSVTRSSSPAASRLVDRDRIARRRTPSPSPHPYLTTRVAQPPMNRTNTAPNPSLHLHHQHIPSRPGTPSQLGLHRRSSSPATPMRHASSRAASPSASFPRNRIQAVTESGLLEASPSTGPRPGHRSRGPSVSSISRPTAAPATMPNIGDQRSNGASPMGYATGTPAPQYTHQSSGQPTPRRTPSVEHASAVRQSRSPVSPSRSNSKRNAMITPPPSPPLTHSINPNLSNADVTALGLGRPAEHRPCFDARSASIALKEQSGYVSFCDVEGLGEPEGVDGDDEDDECPEDGSRGRGKWWEVWRK